MIYIASPYSHDLAVMREIRFNHVYAYTKACMEKGVLCFSPIVYGHQFARDTFPFDFNYWSQLNFSMLSAASALHVLMLPDWEKSAGVKFEILYCTNANIPVHYIEWNGVPSRA